MLGGEIIPGVKVSYLPFSIDAMLQPFGIQYEIVEGLFIGSLQGKP